MAWRNDERIPYLGEQTMMERPDDSGFRDDLLAGRVAPRGSVSRSVAYLAGMAPGAYC